MSQLTAQMGEEVIRSLQAQGLTDEVIQSVVIDGEVERDSATVYDPPTRGGFDAYAQRVRRLRELLVALDWRFSNEKNLCTVTSPCGKHSIAIVTGDGFTGSEHSPQPKYPRGEATTFAAVANSQLDLFAANDLQASAMSSQPALWFLLVHRSNLTDQVFVELSLPESITPAGTVSSWRHRHCLEPIDLTIVVSNVHPDPEPQVDVVVRRKGDSI